MLLAVDDVAQHAFDYLKDLHHPVAVPTSWVRKKLAP